MLLIAVVPSGVVTVTSTVPLPAGLTAVISASLLMKKLVAGVEPKKTRVAAEKPLPAITTGFPAGPEFGVMLLT